MNMRIEAAAKSNATDVERLLELANLRTEDARECNDSTIVAWILSPMTRTRNAITGASKTRCSHNCCRAPGGRSMTAESLKRW